MQRSKTLLLILVSISANCLAQAPVPVSAKPDEKLEQALLRYARQDDLTDWIYAQVQWAAAVPAQRASLLQEATRRVWRAPRTEEEIQAWQDLLTNEGYMLLLGGAIVPSTDAYTEAYGWARSHPEIADDAIVVENILKPLGNNYTRLGDYEQAIFIHEQALAMALKMNDSRMLAGVYSNLANAYTSSGRPGLALVCCSKGLEAANRSPALRGLLLSEQADAFQVSHHLTEAGSSILQSIDLLRKAFEGGDAEAGYWLLTALQQAGDLYVSVPEKALPFYQNALSLQIRLLRQHGDIRQREQAKLFQRLGILYVRLGRLNTADEYQQKALTILRPGRSFATLGPADAYAENTLEDLLYARALLESARGDTGDALRFYSLSFTVGTRLRRELITSTSRERSASDARSRFEEALFLAWSAWEHDHKPAYAQYVLDFMESSKAQLLLEEIRQHRSDDRRPADSLTKRIRLLEGAIAYYDREAITLQGGDSARKAALSAAGAARWEVARLRKAANLSADTAGLPGALTGATEGALKGNLLARTYFAGADAVYVVECSADGIRYVERLSLDQAWQDSVRQFVRRWFSGGANAMIDHPHRYTQEAYALYRQLFGTHPLEKDRAYVFLPDGALDGLPVEALLTRPNSPEDPAAWPLVIRQQSISYGWSLETLRQQRLEGKGGGGFSGFFVSGSHDAAPGLNATLTEEKGLRQYIPSGNWFTDGQATVAAFRSALATSAVVHLSAHAYVQQDSLEAPHIELYDGPFYFFDARVPGHYPTLVVLSACKTGDGRAVSGEGVQSLSRAFTAAGADAVIAGWWNVNDEAAARLMTHFYACMAEGRAASTAQALRRSKLQWLDDPDVPYVQKLPYYWDALQYQGDPTAMTREIMVHPYQAFAYWSLLLAAAAVAVLAWGVRNRFRK